MKYVCNNCGQLSQESREWCPNRNCPSGTLSAVFDYGEYMGDIQIVRLLRVLRMAAVYEAKRGDEAIFVKVAHDDCTEQLKQEATTLQQLAAIQQHPMLPVLMPPYQHVEDKRAYGKTVFQDQTKYYIVFKYVEGEFLRDMLVKNPQPWYLHAAWLTVSIADAVAFINVKAGKVVLNLCPDSVFVRLDKEGIPRPFLIDLGLVSEPAAVKRQLVERYGWPAYTAPEVYEKDALIVPATDVYGLGLLMYEMLAGRPAFPYRLQKDVDIRDAVRKTEPPPLNRSDLSDDIAAIINQSLSKSPGRRQQDAIQFAKQLRTKFGEVPPEKKGFRPSRIQVAVAIFSVLIVIAFILLSIAIA